MKTFRSWLFTPRGALGYFAVGYGLLFLVILFAPVGCAAPTPGHLGDFLGDHGCEIDPQSCK